MISKRKRVDTVDFVIELIGELLSAVFELLTENERVPKPARIAVTLILFIPLVVMSTLCAVLIEGVAVKVLFALVTLFFILGGFVCVRRIIKK